jgi:hypothetical protein
LIRPVTVATSVVPVAVVTAAPPGLALTVYEVMDEPPFVVGADHETRTWRSPAVAVTPLGAVGAVTVEGVTAFDGTLSGEGPTAFLAMTVKR